MAHLGLVPSEHSSGVSVRRGELIKAGNGAVRGAGVTLERPSFGAWKPF
jgi:transposase